MKVTLIALCLMTLSGCSTTDLLGAGVGALTGQDKGLSVDTELVVGDKEQSGVKSGADTKVEDTEVHGDLTTNTTGQETNVDGAENVTLNTGVEFWQAGLFGIVMFIVALFLPQFAIRRK